MKLFLLVFLLLFSSCTEFDRYQPSKKQKAANTLRHRVAKKISQETDLYPCGTGGQMMDEIKMLALSFDYYKPVTLEVSRELLLKSVQTFVAEINNDEEIRPYLCQYPFEPKNVQIQIFLKNSDGTNVSRGKLVVLSAIDGVLEYEVRDPVTDRLTTYYKETYSKALLRPIVKDLPYPYLKEAVSY